jgi:hypothetical protein
VTIVLSLFQGLCFFGGGIFTSSGIHSYLEKTSHKACAYLRHVLHSQFSCFKSYKKSRYTHF